MTYRSPIASAPTRAPCSSRSDVVARHRRAGRAVAHLPRTIRKKDVQHFGRADTVENFAAEVRGEALADVLRQRLAGGGGDAHVHLSSCRQVRRGEHRCIERWYTVENRRTLTTRLIDKSLEHRLRRRPFSHQHDACADRQRKRQRVTQPVRKKQLRGREDDVVFAHTENRLAVQLGRPIKIRMRVHRPLWPAGRARRVQPEADVIGRCLCRCWCGRVLRK